MADRGSADAMADWASLGWKMWMLGIEANMVIGMRVMRIAGGGALAERETQRMISEKMIANAMLPMAMLGVAPGDVMGASERAIGHYGKEVRVNRRRLSR